MTGDHHDYDDDDDFLDDFALDEGAGSASGDTENGDSGDGAAGGQLDREPEEPAADALGDGDEAGGDFDVSMDFGVAGSEADFEDVMAADAADEFVTADLPMPTEEGLPTLDESTLEEFALEDPFDNEAAGLAPDESFGEAVPVAEPPADRAADHHAALAGPTFDDDPLFDSSAAASDEAPVSDGPDEDDLLFEDHTQGMEVSETFARKQQFDEANVSDWHGERLELDSEDALPVAPEPAAIESGVPMDDEAGTPVELGATAEFVTDELTLDAELDSLLEEDEFTLDSEGELEIVGGDTVAGMPAGEPPAEPAAEDGAIDEPAPMLAASMLEDGTPDEVSLEGEEAFVIEDGDWQEVELGASAGLSTDSPGDPGAGLAPEVLEPASRSAADLRAVDEGADLAPVDADESAVEDCEYIGSLSEAANAESAGDAEGWEPLPGTRMDELAEVDGVEAVEDESAGEVVDSFAPAPHLRPAATAVASEHDELYADVDDDEEPEVVGGYQERHKLFGMLTAVAALLFVGLGATIAILRPELIGLRFAPEKIEVVQLPRPRVDLEIVAPPLPATGFAGPDVKVDEPPKVTSEGGAPSDGGPQPNGGDPNRADPNGADPGTREPVGGASSGSETGVPTGGASDPAGADPGRADPGNVDPGRADPAGQGTAAGGSGAEKPPTGDPTVGDPSAGSPAAGDPAASGGESTAGAGGAVTPVVITPSATAGAQENWPVTVLQGQENTPPATKEELVAMGDNLLAGQQNVPVARLAADGVLPGSRAFAQLDNGNYFIGSVKAVNTHFLTLRLRDGEISLARNSIVKLTGLGSADFEELQRATSGFIRLTNNNRLVGSILEGIRDDHVILQTRSNRVMLPKSVVGKIVEQANESGVRIGTTNEEDAWLRRLSEQQLRGGELRAATPKPDGRSGR